MSSCFGGTPVVGAREHAVRDARALGLVPPHLHQADRERVVERVGIRAVEDRAGTAASRPSDRAASSSSRAPTPSTARVIVGSYAITAVPKIAALRQAVVVDLRRIDERLVRRSPASTNSCVANVVRIALDERDVVRRGPARAPRTPRRPCVEIVERARDRRQVRRATCRACRCRRTPCTARAAVVCCTPPAVSLGVAHAGRGRRSPSAPASASVYAHAGTIAVNGIW